MSLDEIRRGLVSLKLRLASGELGPEGYRMERETLLSDLTPEERAALSGVTLATPAIGPSDVGGKALRTQPPSLAELDLGVGTVLFDQWRVRRELGRGGFGVVFEVEDLHLGETQAVKVLDPAMVAREELLARFRREVKVMRTLHHHHIVRVFDYREDLERYVALISMELVGSGSVASLLTAARARELPVAVVLALLGQILDALGAAHAAGVIHRDVTPSNVLLAGADAARLIADPSADPDVRLVDFGIAGMVEKTELSQKSRVLGTAAYVAPEILDPTAEVTPAVDVYGAGALCYELLTGQAPIVTGFRPLELLRTDIEPQLNALIMGMIAAVPGERLTVAEAAHQLAEARVTTGTVAATAGTVATSTAVPPTSEAPTGSAPAALPTEVGRADVDRPDLDSGDVARPEIDRGSLALEGAEPGGVARAGAAPEPAARRRRVRGAVLAGAALVGLLLVAILWLWPGKPGSEPVATVALPAVAQETAAAAGSAQLEVRSNASDDAVTIDGRAYGATPVRAALAPGPHRIVVAKAGCEEDARTIELAAGEALVHRASVRCPDRPEEAERVAVAAQPSSIQPSSTQPSATQPSVTQQPPAPKTVPMGGVSIVFAGTATHVWTDGTFLIGAQVYSFNALVKDPTEVLRVAVPAGMTTFRLIEDEIADQPTVQFPVHEGLLTTLTCQARGVVKHRIIISVDGRTLFDREYALDGSLQKVYL